MQRFRSGDPWRVFWHIAISDYLLGAVLLALAGSLLLAAWLPQTSPIGLETDVTWQAQLQRRFGGADWFASVRPVLRAVGAFYVTNSLWFRFFLALLGLALFVRLVDEIDRMWRARQGSIALDEVVWETVEGSFTELADELRGRRLRVATVAGVASEDEGTNALLCADRWPWGRLGPILVYLGGLVALLGVTITALDGWQAGPLRLTPDVRVPVGRGSGLVLQMKELSSHGHKGSGQIWRGGDTLLGQGKLAVGQPLSGGGVGAFLVGSGPALRVRATLSDTQSLKLATGPDRRGQQALTLVFSKEQPRHQVGVLETDMLLLLTMPQPVTMDALPRVQVFESGSGELIVERETLADSILEVDDVSFDLVPIPYAKVRVVRDPGAWWVQLGAFGLIVGMILWRLWPPRRLWFRDKDESGRWEVTGDLNLLPVGVYLNPNLNPNPDLVDTEKGER